MWSVMWYELHASSFQYTQLQPKVQQLVLFHTVFLLWSPVSGSIVTVKCNIANIMLKISPALQNVPVLYKWNWWNIDHSIGGQTIRNIDSFCRIFATFVFSLAAWTEWNCIGKPTNLPKNSNPPPSAAPWDSKHHKQLLTSLRNDHPQTHYSANWKTIQSKLN